MTDVLDLRRDPIARIDEMPKAPTVRSDPSDEARTALASLSAAAGVIHLALVPSHWSDAVVVGAGFAMAGVFQLWIAARILTHPSRALFRAAIVVNFLLIGAWAVSRTFGLPFGSNAGHPETVGFIDLTTVGFEIAFIVATLAVLRRPRTGSRSSAGRVGLGVLLPIAVAALTIAALTSPSAADHAADSHGEGAAGGHAHGDVDDKGLSLIHNGQHAQIEPQPLDDATQAKLDAQLDITRAVALRYPTVADAEAGGFTRVGPYIPGIGAHYLKISGGGLNFDGSVSDDDLANPLTVVYDGTAPDSPVAGFMFYSQSPIEPEGFAGRNDVWHYHEALCLDMSGPTIEAPYGLDHAATPAQCEAAGGRIMESSQYMVHVWSVPGYEVTNEHGGMFGEVNPKLDCPDGTYYMLPVDEWAAHKYNVCKTEAA